jgi:3-deoxy-D-manno-octulosonic-acid transferase
VGPHTYNFSEAAEGAIAAGAALRVADAKEAVGGALALNPAQRAAMGERASAFVAAHRGAVKRLVDWIEETAAKRR